MATAVKAFTDKKPRPPANLYLMKPHLIIFGILIAGFIVFNLFFLSDSDRTNTAINIVYASVLFGYISFMAYSLLRKMRK